MARICPACGRGNDEDASFCQGCGAALAEDAGQAAPPDVVTPPPEPPVTPPPGAGPSAGGPPRRGKPAPRWLVTLIAVAAITLACVLVFVLFPRGDGGTDDANAPTPSAGATVGVSPSPSLDQYLAGAVGPRADRLAAITADGTIRPIMRFSGQQIWQAAYSPDGTWLACIAGTYKRSELWLFDSVTGDARQATANTPNVVAVDSIAWLSPTELLMAGYTETPKATGENADFLVYETATEGFAPLSDASGVSLRGVSVSASREGARVAFVTYSDRKTNRYGLTTAKERLEVLDRASGEVIELGSNTADFDVNARAFDEPLRRPKARRSSTAAPAATSAPATR